MYGIILSSQILILFRLDQFQTTTGSPIVIYFPCLNLCNVLMCVYLCKYSARWAVSSTELKDSLGSDSVSSVPELANTHCKFTSNGNKRACWERGRVFLDRIFLHTKRKKNHNFIDFFNEEV